MSNRAINWVYELEVITDARELVLLLTMADEANSWGEVWRGQEALGKRSRLGERTVRRYLARFERIGLVSRTHHYGPDGKRVRDKIILRIEDYRPLRPVVSLPAADDTTTGQSLAGQITPKGTPKYPLPPSNSVLGTEVVGLGQEDWS